jgi:tRNA threonylcarbamoyladenosine biosynthesis protein TsaE
VSVRGPDPAGWTVHPATPQDADEVLAVTRAAFAEYAQVQPPPSSLRETAQDVRRDLAGSGGLLARDPAGQVVAAARFSEHDGGFWLRRLAVPPDHRGLGLGRALVAEAEEEAARRGHRELRVGTRTPLRQVRDYWERLGFRQYAEREYWVELARPVPVRLAPATAADTRQLGRRLAGLLRAGDLVLLTGDLGAGKTTLAQGLGEGLGVRGPVTSPTFVIARVHPSRTGGPALVHVDAYRLSSLAEVDDLDLDASLEESVTVVEWGAGLVEGLSEDRLEVTLHRPAEDDRRAALLRGWGARWAGVDLAGLG